MKGNLDSLPLLVLFFFFLEETFLVLLDGGDLKYRETAFSLVHILS